MYPMIEQRQSLINNKKSSTQTTGLPSSSSPLPQLPPPPPPSSSSSSAHLVNSSLAKFNVIEQFEIVTQPQSQQKSHINNWIRIRDNDDDDGNDNNDDNNNDANVNADDDDKNDKDENGDSATNPSENGSDNAVTATKAKHRNRKPKSFFQHIISYFRETFTGVKESQDSEIVEEIVVNKYQPESLRALCSLTRFSESEMKRLYRGFKTDCPNGVIREDNFRTIYSSFFPRASNSGQYAHYVFQMIDENNTGLITFEDFIKTLSVLARGTLEEKLKWIFQLYDINRDGKITVDEVTEIVGAVYDLVNGPASSTEDCSIVFVDNNVNEIAEKVFKKMDLNCDGIITFDEFISYCSNDPNMANSIEQLRVVI